MDKQTLIKAQYLMTVLLNINDENVSWKELNEENFKNLNNKEFFDIKENS